MLSAAARSPVVAVIVKLATRLSQRLRRGDPLAGRVALSKLDFLLCGLGGIFSVQAQRLFTTPQTAGQRG